MRIFLLPLCLPWWLLVLVSVLRFIYKGFLIAQPSQEGLTLIPCVYYTGWIAVVVPTDRPRLVRNRCVIERFCSFFVLPWRWIVCRLGVFVILMRQIASLFSVAFLAVFCSCCGVIHVKFSRNIGINSYCTDNVQSSRQMWHRYGA